MAVRPGGFHRLPFSTFLLGSCNNIYGMQRARGIYIITYRLGEKKRPGFPRLAYKDSFNNPDLSSRKLGTNCGRE